MSEPKATEDPIIKVEDPILKVEKLLKKTYELQKTMHAENQKIKTLLIELEIKIKIFEDNTMKNTMILINKVQDFENRINQIEENIYCIYTGIKTNQFLYAHENKLM